jgi:hypothetical protein
MAIAVACSVGGAAWHSARLISRPVPETQAPAAVERGHHHLPPGNVAASVPRLTVVRLAGDGTPLELWTNTGARPDGQGEIFALRADGTTQRDQDLAGAIEHAKFTGSWRTPGSWHPWPGHLLQPHAR